MHAETVAYFEPELCGDHRAMTNALGAYRRQSARRISKIMGYPVDVSELVLDAQLAHCVLPLDHWLYTSDKVVIKFLYYPPPPHEPNDSCAAGSTSEKMEP